MNNSRIRGFKETSEWENLILLAELFKRNYLICPLYFAIKTFTRKILDLLKVLPKVLSDFITFNGEIVLSCGHKRRLGLYFSNLTIQYIVCPHDIIFA